MFKNDKLTEEMNIVHNQQDVSKRSKLDPNHIEGEFKDSYQSNHPLKYMLLNNNNEDMEGYSENYIFSTADDTYSQLRINDPKLFQFEQAFERPWYNVNNKV
jgi:hypothetical protein